MGQEQAGYQVRFDWGAAGAAALDAADVLVRVSALPGADAHRVDPGHRGAVLDADFRTAAAAAAWIARLQHRLHRRVTIAVVALGRTRGERDLRFAVEDLLAAGAVVEALGELGIDATSPEAAVAEAAYRSLRRAVGHLVSASVTAQVGTVSSGAARIDTALGADDATVLRGHPEADSA